MDKQGETLYVVTEHGIQTWVIYNYVGGIFHVNCGYIPKKRKDLMDIRDIGEHYSAQWKGWVFPTQNIDEAKNFLKRTGKS